MNAQAYYLYINRVFILYNPGPVGGHVRLYVVVCNSDYQASHNVEVKITTSPGGELSIIPPEINLILQSASLLPVLPATPIPHYSNSDINILLWRTKVLGY